MKFRHLHDNAIWRLTRGCIMNFSRNIGLISENDQKKLGFATVLVAGVGGMGGVAAEVLVRMGIGRIVLCDFDKFEDVNLNRQIHCSIDTFNHYKVDVLKKQFLAINPNLEIKILKEKIGLDNINDLLVGVDIIVNGMDQMQASLILERSARQKGIIIVDAWLTPFASVFVMDAKSPHWEDFLDLPTKNYALHELNEDICRKAVVKEVEFTLSHFDPFSIINKDVVEEVLSDKRPRPSLAPVVWLSGVLMANEVFKIVLGIEHVGFKGIFYNQYSHQIMPGNVNYSKIKKIA